MSDIAASTLAAAPRVPGMASVIWVPPAGSETGAEGFL